MTSRALSAWFALGCSLLAVLVAVDRPHWFGLSPHPAAATERAAPRAAAPGRRSAPWLIRRANTATR